jgi:hypothetical protein
MITGFWSVSFVWNSKKHDGYENGCLRPQLKGWETLTLFCPLERANLNQWAAYVSITTSRDQAF